MTTRTPHQQDSLENDEGVDEAPPAYSAVVDHSEQRIALGPSRPFESEQRYYPPPPQPPQSHPVNFFPQYNLPEPSQSQPSIQNGTGEVTFSPPNESPPPKPYHPTVTPKPGQALLHEGKLLVFPELGHLKCPKCYDTGYKHNDPSHPCKSCWKRFGKPFNGPLRIAVTSPDANPSARQQPLPVTNSPAASPIPPSSTFPGYLGPSNRNLQYPNQNPPYSNFGGNAPNFYGPGPQPFNSGAYYGPNYGPDIRVAPPGMPPPGALILSPGDPRLGGVLCRMCGGDGQISGLFFFETETCGACRGTGRVFY